MASRTRVLQSSLAAVLMIGAAALTLTPVNASAFSMSDMGSLARGHSTPVTSRSDVSQTRTTSLGRLGGLKTDSAPNLSTGGAKPVQLADGPTRQLPKTDSAPTTPKMGKVSDAPKLTDKTPSKPNLATGDKGSSSDRSSSDGRSFENGKRADGRGAFADNAVGGSVFERHFFHDKNKIIRHGRKQWARTLHIRAGDGSNTLVNVQVSGTPGITASYDPASQTVTGYGGPGTITITGEVETLDGNIPFTMTIDVN